MQKPQCLESFLGPFVNDLNSIQFFEFQKKPLEINIKYIVADAPARSFIKNIKTHNAYYGCERCYRRGPTNYIE